MRTPRLSPRRALPALAALTLASCSSNTTSNTALNCAALDPATAASAPLTQATFLALETNDFAKAASLEDDVVVSVEFKRDATGNFSFDATNTPPPASPNEEAVEAIRLVDGEVFVRYHGSNDNRWTPLGSDFVADLTTELDTLMNEMITGSESITTGVYQLNDTLETSFQNWQSWTRKNGMIADACEYAYTNTDGSSVSVILDADGRVMEFSYANTDARANLRVGYDPQTIQAPALSSVNPSDDADSTPQEALDQVTPTELEQLATALDRELRSIAAQLNIAPNSRGAILEMIRAGALATNLKIDAIAASGTRTTIWDRSATAQATSIPDTISWLELTSGDSTLCVSLSDAPATASVVRSGACTW